MDFSLSEQQLVWKERAAQFADQELRPSWKELDLSGEPLAAICSKARDQGVLDPWSMDGKSKGSLDILTAALMTEELSRGDFSFAMTFVNRYLSFRAAQLSFNQDFRDDVGRRLTHSSQGIEVAFLWPESTSDDPVMTDTIEDVQDADAVDAPLNNSLSYAHMAAECFVGYGRLGLSGATLRPYLVLAERSQLRTLEERRDTFGPPSMRLYGFCLERVTQLKVVGLETNDHYDRLIDSLLSERMILFNAITLGITGAAFEYVLRYSRERMAFGRPIIQHQAISLKLADIYIGLEAARLLLWEAADQQAPGARQEKRAHAALSYGRGVALRAVSNALQMMGGHGYLKDHPVEKWMREVQLLRLLG